MAAITTMKPRKPSIDATSIEIYEESLSRDTLEVLNSMRQYTELCDVNLLVDGKTITAHRAILAASSPYFRAMFLSGFSEVNEEFIEVKDMGADALAMVIEYFYTSYLKIDADTVEDILKVCVVLRLDTLVDHCETFLRRNMTPSNCLGLHSVAKLFCLDGLTDHAKRFTLWNFQQVFQEDEFSLLPYDQLRSLIRDDTLKVQSEEAVFDAVWKWINHDFHTRKEYVGDIMQYVRFPLMSLNFLVNNNTVKRLLQENTICKELVREARMYQALLSNDSSGEETENFRIRPRMASEEIYVIGGWSNGQKLSSVQCFNVDTLQWSVVAGMSVAHVSREDYFRVVVANDELYTVSRYKVGKYDPISNSWMQVANGPDVQCKWAGVCESEGFVYVLGGHSSMCAKRFDPETLQWESLPVMTSARYYPGVAVFQGKVYAVGGLDHLWAPLRTAERYDPKNSRWEPIASMTTARWSLGVAVLGELLYAIGGSDNRESYSNSVEVYNAKTDTWSQAVASMNNGRRCLGVAVVNDLIYVVGGRVVNSIEYYDKDQNTWSVVGTVNARCNFGCVALRLM
ncbi:kelch-like protein diablo [Exaiptasia diaphana]|uniref:BTB domain-containing protein n=1 Tax=Exaiptasia diaphana TaxID=2652724 RepID=A0A913Y8M3_EXADI|nr:kelch-like protein diablo [Exaiptasia diaphana]KXJ28832.1 Kelch-like protein 20 [Exaiptasia diaphana]